MRNKGFVSRETAALVGLARNPMGRLFGYSLPHRALVTGAFPQSRLFSSSLPSVPVSLSLPFTFTLPREPDWAGAPRARHVPCKKPPPLTQQNPSGLFPLSIQQDFSMNRQKRPGDRVVCCRSEGAASWQSHERRGSHQSFPLFGADSCAQLHGKAELMEQGQPRPP